MNSLLCVCVIERGGGSNNNNASRVKMQVAVPPPVKVDTNTRGATEAVAGSSTVIFRQGSHKFDFSFSSPTLRVRRWFRCRVKMTLLSYSHFAPDYSLWLIYFDGIITLSQVYIDLLFFVSNIDSGPSLSATIFILSIFSPKWRHVDY